MLLTEKIVRRALEEDLGRGDITSKALIPDCTNSHGEFICNSEGIIAGIEVLKTVFRMLDKQVEVDSFIDDGNAGYAGMCIARVNGNTRSILAGERVALNFLQRMSGIATLTNQVVKKVAPYGCTVTDTRKTTPGLRVLEKYAVTMGGGKNHRFGLDDAVLIKDNHIKAAGGIGSAVFRARKKIGHLVKIEVEAETLEQVKEALDNGANVIMLDNMFAAEMKQAVEMIGNKAVIEASGGITPDTAVEAASAGVSVISLGWITHSMQPVDIKLELD
ncbi:MAG: carboxylating nicotinate-nucleotide diphosphorylase [Clostridiales bacterium]|nr:carboxylating nicotinate-nucleotide diphosphorylase [Clostridiales bacterium]MCF8023774.1 carboxylating nicotinate-nucleotide diphosphorylase [Clostridiales bacterium]